jgi:spore coat protein U-like protein
LITRGAAAAAALLCVASAVHAATTTTSFTVQITIVATCVINSATTLNFSSTQGVLSANVDQTSTIQVTCTSSTPYSIGLSKGADSGATVAARKLSDGTNTITYSLYTDASRSTVWGNTVGVDVVSATGNGSAQSYTVYGRVPPQATPPPGTYNDTVTVTVNY